MLTECELRENFAGNLTALRAAKGMTQMTLARVLHLSRYAIISYEHGRTAPSAFALYQVSAYFHVPMEKLVTKRLTKKG